MTGYGRGIAESDGRRAVVEVRAVNHRFVDLKLRGATLDPVIEDKLSQRVRAVVERGSVTVTVRLEAGEGASAVTIDTRAAQRLHAELVELARSLGIAPTISLETLCAQPGVVIQRDLSGDLDAVTAAVMAAFDAAGSALVSMRESEGAALRRDLESRIDRLAELSEAVAVGVTLTPEDARKKLEERIGKLLAGSRIEVDAARLAQEIAILADKLDITEELVRLRSHFDQFRALAGDRGAVGRRLDFLVQELGREFNTIASKSSSADIARLVVEAKAELEKIREQVQNVE